MSPAQPALYTIQDHSPGVALPHTQQSRKYPTDKATGRCNGGNSPTEASSTQVCKMTLKLPSTGHVPEHAQFKMLSLIQEGEMADRNTSRSIYILHTYYLKTIKEQEAAEHSLFLE